MRAHLSVFAGLASLFLAAQLLAGCAQAPLALSSSGASPGAAPRGASGSGDDAFSDPASAYGLYLAGHAAVDASDTAAAEGYFDKAARLDQGPDHGLISSRAFTSALLAGDVPAAAAAAPQGPGSDLGLRHLGAVTRAVEALAVNKPAAAFAILTGPDSGAPNETAAALLTPFAAAAAGHADASIVHPVIKDEPIAQFFANLDQGELFERAHRYEEAETAYRALIAKGDPGGIASLELGQMLERRGRGAEAAAIYGAALEAHKGGEENGSELRGARLRAAAHKSPPPMPSLKAGEAEALIAPATALLIEKQQELALAYLRLALRLDPDRDEAWLLVGDILAAGPDIDGTRAAYGRVKPSSSQYLSARSKLAWSYQDKGDKTAALVTAQDTLAKMPDDQDAKLTVADLLRADDRYAESAKLLDDLIAIQKGPPDWRLYYMRAVDLEETGRLDDSERDLQAALKQRPDEPELLNFLGYSWIDRGVKLPEALAMVRKAVQLDPQSGAMIDSLGWGYYRTGDYPAAVAKLEEAVALEPADPDVNNHLGDAYWRVGRKTEAGFQWRRVLGLNPTAKLKTEVEGKLASGLDAVPAAPVVAIK